MSRMIPGYYWRCQIGGWGAVLICLYVFCCFINCIPSLTPLYYAASGFLATHFLRFAIIRFGWLKRPLKYSWPGILIGTILASALATGFYEVGAYATGTSLYTWQAWFHIIEFAFFILPWTLIYYMYGQVGKTRQDELEKRRLALRVEEMQQQAETTAVDIDFIMNTLSRIKTLVDENPAACRAAITEFSILLRVATLSSKS